MIRNTIIDGKKVTIHYVNDQKGNSNKKIEEIIQLLIKNNNKIV